MIVTDERMRAIHKCSRLGIHYKGEVLFNEFQNLIRSAYIHSLKLFVSYQEAKADGTLDDIPSLEEIAEDVVVRLTYGQGLHKTLRQDKFETLRRQILFGADFLFKILPPQRYVPLSVYAPVSLNVGRMQYRSFIPLIAKEPDVRTVLHMLNMVPETFTKSPLETDLVLMAKIQYIRGLFGRNDFETLNVHSVYIDSPGYKHVYKEAHKVSRDRINLRLKHDIDEVKQVSRLIENKIALRNYNCADRKCPFWLDCIGR